MRARSRAAASTNPLVSSEADDEIKGGETSGRRLSKFSIVLILALLGFGCRLLWLHISEFSPASMPVHAEPAAEAARRASMGGGLPPVAKPVAARSAGAHDAPPSQAAPQIEVQSVGEAMKKELGKCRTSKDRSVEQRETEYRPGESNQMLDSLRCIFRLVYPAEETEAATYGLHTAHPENIYGEIPPESVAQIITELGFDKPPGAGGVFYDLGSGVGRMALQVHLTTEASRSVGIEIAVQRHDIAVKALKVLERADFHSLIPGLPLGERKIEFMAQNITEIDMGDATGIYMASLYFPKDVLWMLAEKLSALKTGTKIMTLVKFPFDIYGKRKLAADSPMQSLRLRKSYSNIRMTWSEENNVFLYEVDHEEAFPKFFDVAKATTSQLVDEVYRRAKIDRMQWETPEFTGAVKTVVEALQLGPGDDICEVGTTSGAMALQLVLDSEIDRVFSASIFEGDDRQTPGARAKAALEELVPGRIPWHRRVDFVALPSLEKFINMDGKTKEKDFASHCHAASIVVLHPMRTYEDGLDALAKIATILPAGAIVLALGMDMTKNSACTFGLLPLLQDITLLPLSAELDLTISLDVFVVAPQDKHLASMKLPGLSSLREAVAQVGSEKAKLRKLVAEKLMAQGGEPDGNVETAVVQQVAVRNVLDSARFSRMQLVLGGGMTVEKSGKTSFHATAASGDVHHRRPGGDVPVRQLAPLWLARFQGDAKTAYSCLEANLYALASYAPQISNHEKKAGLFPEHSATYGEVDPIGMDAVMRKLGGLKASDGFFDLGSGLGKVVLQLYVSTPVARVVGVELGEARHKGAIDAMATLRHRFPALDAELKEGRTIDLRHEDVLQTDLKGVTVVWMGSLAFPKSLMGKIAERLLDHASVGCRVVTMIEFPPLDSRRKLKLLQKEGMNVAVRWTEANEAKVFVYEIVQAE